MEAVLDVGDGVGVGSGHFLDGKYEKWVFLKNVDEL